MEWPLPAEQETITPNVLIYSYVSKSMWWQLPRPVLKSFAADIKYCHQLGIDRYFCPDMDCERPLPATVRGFR